MLETLVFVFTQLRFLPLVVIILIFALFIVLFINVVQTVLLFVEHSKKALDLFVLEVVLVETHLALEDFRLLLMQL